MEPLTQTRFMPSYFAHESCLHRRRRRHRRRHQDLALLPRHARRGDRGAVQPGPERRGHGRHPRSATTSRSRTTSRSTKAWMLEDDVFCGPSCVFTNVTNPRSHVSRKSEYRRTLVRRGSSIGANATIVCGVTLGEYCFIGAGAVVRSDVPAFALMVGVPARRVGWMCQCGVRLQLQDGRASCAALRRDLPGAGGGSAAIDRPRSAG